MGRSQTMTFAMIRRLAPLALCAAALAGATAAKADVEWTVDGIFDDGATLHGVFDLNQYGDFSSYDMNTSAGPVIGPIEYTLHGAGAQSWTWPSKVEFEIGYTTTLHLEFTDNLTPAEAYNPIVIGPSFECITSYSCFNLQNGPTRYLVSGSAVGRTIPDDLGNGNGGNAVPEPASWALMIVGFGMTGGQLRARRQTILA